MNRVVAPLQPGDRGPGVDDLHQALIAILALGGLSRDPAAREELGRGLRADRDRRAYRDHTARAVLALQGTHGLQPDGRVDERTAALINDLLSELGLLGEPVPPPPAPSPAPPAPEPSPAPQPASPAPTQPPLPEFEHLVRGVVRYQDGLPIPDLRVEAFDRQLRSEKRLGESVKTRADGTFEIFYSVEAARRRGQAAVALLVRCFGKLDGEEGERVLAESPVIYDAANVEKVVLRVPGGLKRRWSRFEQLVAEITPLLDGATLESLAEDEDRQELSWLSGKLGISLLSMAQLVGAHKLGKETGIDPAVFYGFSRRGLPNRLGDLLGQTSERRKEALLAAIRDLEIPGAVLDQLDAVEVRFAALAADQAIGGEAEDAGPLARTLSLAGVSAGAQRVLAEKIVAHRTPMHALWTSLADDPAVRDELPRAQLALQLATLTGGEPTVMEELLGRAEIRSARDLAAFSPQEWQAVAGRRDGQGGLNMPEFVRGKTDEERIGRYASTMQQMVAAAFPVETLAHRAQADESTPQGTRTFMRNLTSRDLTVDFAHVALDRFVDEHPELLEGVANRDAMLADVKTRQRLYRLTRTHETMKPLMQEGLTSAIAINRLGRQDFVRRFSEPLGGTTEALKVYQQAGNVTAGVLNLMANLAPWFRMPMYALPQTMPVVEGAPDWTALFGSFDLCACDQCSSAHGPAAYFVELLAYLAERRLTLALPGQPVRVVTARSLLFEQRPDLGDIQLTCDNTNLVLPYIDLVCEVLEAQVAPFVPFDLPDGCQVDLDGRVLSPQVRQAFADAGLTLRDDAVVVVVDLSLAWMIADRQHVFNAAIDGITAGRVGVMAAGLQTDGSEAELRANPSHVNAAAYTELAAAKHGWRLPFDAWNAEARSWIEQSSVSRASVMQAFQPAGANPDPPDLAIASETLAIAPAQVRVILALDAPRSKPWEYWGLTETVNLVVKPDPADFNREIEASLGWIEALAHVPLFLQRSTLAYDELLALLSTRLINPTGTLRIESADAADPASCELQKLRMVGLDEKVLDTMHRFVRLSRNVPWSMRTLDLAIGAFQGRVADPGDRLSPALIEGLAVLRELERRTGQAADTLLAWWGSIDTRARREADPDGPASLYDTLFLNETVAKPVAVAFQLGAARDELASTAGTMDAQAAAVAAGTGLLAEELAQLRRARVTSATVDLVTLSAVYRHASLSRALGLPMDETLRWLDLSGLNPFDANHPRDALVLLEVVAELGAHGFDAQGCDALLRHQLRADSDHALPQDSVGGALTALRVALRQIGEDSAKLAANSDGVAKGLALLGWSAAWIQLLVQALASDVTTATEVTSLPAAPVLPAGLAGRVAWDPHSGTLGLRGLMSAEDFAALRAVALDAAAMPGYLAGIDRLERSDRVLRALARSLAWPVFQTSLDPAHVPDRSRWPAFLRDRLFYDAPGKTLRFAGPMLEADRLALVALPGADAAFLAAVDALQAAWLAYLPPAETAFLGDAEFAALVAPETSTSERPARLLARFQPLLVLRLQRATVTQALGQATTSDAAVVTALLPAASLDAFLGADFAQGDPRMVVDVQRFGPLFDTILLLDKGVRIARALEIDADAIAALLTLRGGVTPRPLRWHLAAPTSCGWLDLQALPVKPQPGAAPQALGALLRLAAAARVRRRLGGALFDRLLRMARDPASTEAAVVEALADGLRSALGWDADDTRAMVGADGLRLTVARDVGDEWAFVRLMRCRELARKLNARMSEARSWAREAIGPAQTLQMRQALLARVGDAAWATLAAPVQDRLRELRRNALVDYLLPRAPRRPDAQGHNRPLWKNMNDLYAWFLIDVEMAPCFLTSRIKQACGSAQLFTQRLMLNLVPGVRIDEAADDAWHDWEWMKNYRVWEANRKIFLYPENWLEPDVREDKTPFFRELETELLQNEVTERTAEDAFLHYLEKLYAVAKLEIVSCYQQEFADGSVPALHVIGRTAATPPLYYYRQRASTGRWSPWERIDVDIEGDHLVPVIWNRRLHLFWAVFSVKADTSIPAKDSGGAPPNRYFEIQLAWTYQRGEGWAAKRITRSRVRSALPVLGGDPNDDGRDAHTFFTSLSDDGLRIWPAYANPAPGAAPAPAPAPYGTAPLPSGYGGNAPAPSAPAMSVPTFFFSGGLDDALIEGGRSITGVDNPTGTRVRAMRFEEGLKTSLPLPLVGTIELLLPFPVLMLPSDVNTGSEEAALATHPGSQPFRLTYAHQDRRITGLRPFFYADQAHAFLVEPGFVIRMERQWADPQHVDPGRWQSIVSKYYGAKAGTAIAKTGLVRRARVPAAEPAPVVAPVVNAGPFILHTVDEVRQKRRAKAVEKVRPWLDTVAIRAPIGLVSVPRTELQYRFEVFHHPFATAFVRELNRGGIDALMALSTQCLREDYFGQYKPTALVDPAAPASTVDFAPAGSYGIYNWELFFHAPLLVATRLMANRQFAQARRWLHYIFDPTNTSSEDAPAKFWRARPLHDLAREDTLKQRIQVLLHPNADGAPSRQLAVQIAEWRRNPFSPHAIARLRFSAYQKAVVMKYLNNLIAWGDQLFRTDTIESINEATQLYLLAADVLGPKPPSIRRRAAPQLQTYNSLDPSLSSMSDKLVAIEHLVPVDSPDAVQVPRGTTALQVPTIPYFCVPPNDKLAAYWDTVADRLFKIRHCMNIEGVERRLALFEPPIDPALLVRARAAGVDLGTVLADLNAPLPHYRFAVMAQKATELCGEVKTFGTSMLAAMEKRDAEAMALLRSTQEIELLRRVGEVRREQLREASENITAFERSRAMVEARRDFYRDVVRINANEQLNLDKLGSAKAWQTRAQIAELVANVVPMIGDFDIGASGWASSPVVKWRWGGVNIGMAAQAAARGMNLLAAIDQFDASSAGLKGGFDRRWDDWKQQERLAELELLQIDRQIEAARIRQAIADKELANHQQQLDNARAVDEMMRTKFTNRELYDWLIEQLAAVHFQAYQLAYDTARRAERAFRHELALPQSSFIQFGYWDSLKRGLLAGDRLMHDIKRMEVAYLEQNGREFELTKHVSLEQLHPQALEQLRQTGTCFFELPEALFDLDFPGHYLRRIKSVSISMPSVSGPYTSISAQLTLLGHRTRREATATGEYAWRGPDDPRFDRGTGGMDAIATSGAQGDSGLFELNFRDERYLPFEGAGAISQWRLRMPALQPKFPRQVDPGALANVVITLRMTCRDGGEPLRTAATNRIIEALRTMQVEEGKRGLFRLFSVQHDLTDAWHAFAAAASVADGTPAITANLHAGLFPSFTREHAVRIQRLVLLIRTAGGAVYDVALDPLSFEVTRPGAAAAATLQAQLSPGDLQASGALCMDLGAGLLVADDPAASAWRFTLDALPAALTRKVQTPDGEKSVLDPGRIDDLGILVRYTLD